MIGATRRRTVKGLVALALAVVVAGGLTACGGSRNSDDDSQNTESRQYLRLIEARYGECLSSENSPYNQQLWVTTVRDEHDTLTVWVSNGGDYQTASARLALDGNLAAKDSGGATQLHDMGCI